jgi:hypothetical protein
MNACLLFRDIIFLPARLISCSSFRDPPEKWHSRAREGTRSGKLCYPKLGSQSPKALCSQLPPQSVWMDAHLLEELATDLSTQNCPSFQ